MRIIDNGVKWDFGCELLVEVGCVDGARLNQHVSWSNVTLPVMTHDSRLEWRWDRLLPKLLEVNMPREERMILDILSASNA